MGMELFFGGIIEPNTDKNSKICPCNHFKLLFQTNVMQFGKKNTHLLLAFEELDIEIDLSIYLQTLNILNLAL